MQEEEEIEETESSEGREGLQVDEMRSVKSYHWREVSWQPMYIVWREGHQEREKRSPAQVSR